TLVDRGAYDLSRREADPLVDDLHAHIAGAHGDLLGAVRVSVETWLTDQELDAAAELGGCRLDRSAHAVELRARALGSSLSDAGRRAVLAEHAEQGRAPFARGHAGFGAADRAFHDVAAFL